MSSLELKVPPPAVALFFGFLMWFASSLAAPVEVPFGARVAVALVLASLGLVFGISGMASVWRAKTTMNPTKPTATSSLVTTGPFRFTRNPMYLSLLLPVFVLYINQFQIKPEERVLSSRFSQEYAAYKGRVRRWL